jgi:hypothetical protein
VTGAQIPNRDICAYALFDLGGRTASIDIEDIFARCFQLAPSRFGWRLHPEFPHFRNLTQALSDFEREHPDSMIRSERGHRRQLTSTGANWVEERLERFQALANGTATARSNVRPHRRALQRLVKDPLAERYAAGDHSAPRADQVAEALGIAPDRPATTWSRRLEQLRAEAKDADRSDLDPLIDWLQTYAPA